MIRFGYLAGQLRIFVLFRAKDCQNRPKGEGLTDISVRPAAPQILKVPTRDCKRIARSLRF